MKWRKTANGTMLAADVGNWTLYAAPLEDGEYEGVAIGYGHLWCKMKAPTQAEAKRGIVDMLIGLIDEWKAQAEKLKEATK